MPRLPPAQLRQPHGHACAWATAKPARSRNSRTLPLRPGHCRRCWPTIIDIPVEEKNLPLLAGINHMAFFLRFEHDGEDLYPALRQLDPPDCNRVRYEMFKRFGYFVTESSEHFAEYSPWFIKEGREDLIERFNIPLDEYPRRCENRSPSGNRCGTSWRRRLDHRADPRIWRPHHPRVRDRPAVRVYGNVPNGTACDLKPAGGVLRRGAVLVDRSTALTRSPSVRFRANSRR